MSADDREANALLERLVLGEVRPDSREVLDWFAADPGLKRRYEEVRRVLSALEDVGHTERADIRRALSDEGSFAGAPGEDRVEAIVRESAGLAPARNPSAARRAAPWIMALAASLLALTFITGTWPFNADRRDAQQMLGGDSIELLAPLGDGASFDAFRWSDPAGEAAWYEVHVYDGRPSGGTDRLWKSSTVEGADVSVPAGEADRWPKEIRWELVPYDASGQPGQPVVGRALRSSD